MPRPKGTTKEVMAARRTIAAMTDMKDKINTSVVDEAIQVVLDTMRNPNAAPATKRQCAGDIISLYFKLHKDSIELLEEGSGETPDEEPEQKDDEEDGAKVLRMDFKRP